MPELVTCMFDKDQNKTEGVLRGDIVFYHYKSTGVFCCNISFDGIYSKTLKHPLPHPTYDTYTI